MAVIRTNIDGIEDLIISDVDLDHMLKVCFITSRGRRFDSRGAATFYFEIRSSGFDGQLPQEWIDSKGIGPLVNACGRSTNEFHVSWEFPI